MYLEKVETEWTDPVPMSANRDIWMLKDWFPPSCLMRALRASFNTMTMKEPTGKASSDYIVAARQADDFGFLRER